MIYLVCPICGYAIDIFTEEEASNPVRSKRMKYLLTRDQICPNCINVIPKCEKIEANESEIPIIKVELGQDEQNQFSQYLKNKGYVVGTKFALDEFRGGKK
ncbi:MAG: hypothetical protein QXN66_04175 [Thermoplasmatales archaeon]